MLLICSVVYDNDSHLYTFHELYIFLSLGVAFKGFLLSVKGGGMDPHTPTVPPDSPIFPKFPQTPHFLNFLKCIEVRNLVFL